MRIMDESVTVTAEEQHVFAERLVAMGQRLEARARQTGDEVIEGVADADGETVADAGLAADAEVVSSARRPGPAAAATRCAAVRGIVPTPGDPGGWM